MSQKLLKVGLGALLLLASSSLAFAAGEKTTTPSKPTETQMLLDQISVIGSKFNIKNIAGSAAYLGVNDIRDQGIADINRLLRRVPGVIVREEDGFGVFQNISLRGVDMHRSNKITIMEDGILTAPAPYSAPDAYYSPAIARMSGLEVLKGSSQVKFGPRTTGGVINYISTPIPTSQRYYMKASYGNMDELRNHTYFGNTENGESGKFGYLIEYYGRNNSGFKVIDDELPSIRGEQDTGMRRMEPMIKMSYEPKSAMYQRFEFKYGHSDLDFNETYLGNNTRHFRKNPIARLAATRFDEINSEHHRTYLRHFLEVNKNTNIITTMYGNTFHRNWQKLDKVNNVSLDLVLANEGLLNVARGRTAGSLKVKNNNREYYLYGIQSNLTHKAQMGEVEHNIEVGLRYHYDQIRRFQQTETYTQDANGAITAVSVDGGGESGNRLQETAATAVNVSDAMKWGKWTLTPGIRGEWMQQSWDQYKDGSAKIINQQTDYVFVVGGGTLKYDYYEGNGKDIDFFTGLNRGFSPADPKSKMARVDPETSLGFEIGTRYANAPKAFSAEAIFFLTDLDDLVLKDDIGDTSSGDTINGGKVRTMGLELLVNYDAGLANDWTFQTPSYVSFTYTDAEIRSSLDSTSAGTIFAGASKGNEVPYVSEYVISFGTGVIYKKFNVNFDASYRDDQWADGRNLATNVNTSGVPSERFGKIDSMFVVDATIGYQFNNQVRVFSNFKNITDTQRIVSREPQGPRSNMPFAMMAGLEFTL